MKTLYLGSDYQEGAHPQIMERLLASNMESTAGYGRDDYCASAKEKIRQACACPKAGVHFLLGGTQTNKVVISAALASYQGVVAAESGHISLHEAGAIEMGGHKVMTIPHQLGKISGEDILKLLKEYESDGNKDHMVMPGMVYISQPTEYGSLYSLQELEEISKICREYKVLLYVDGARLAYALACDENDVSLEDLARLADVFYIGGTKCGCLFGEAVVMPRKDLIPHFFTIIKQQGALLAKGRLLGLQFDTLFTNNLYGKLGKPGIEGADKIRRIFRENGYRLAFPSPTNQVFIVVADEWLQEREGKLVYSFWEKYDKDHTVIRLAASWATDLAALDKLYDLV